MSARQTIRECLDLLDRSDRRRLGLVTIGQMSTALLDLAGVLALGAVTALAVTASSGAQLPPAVAALLDRWGLGGQDVLAVTVGLAAVAALMLIAKSVTNLLLTRWSLRFLAVRQALVAGRLAAGLLARPLLQVERRSSDVTTYALTEGVTVALVVVLGQAIIGVSELTLLVVLTAGLLVVSPWVTLFTVLYFVAIALVLQKILSGWAGRSGRRAAESDVESRIAVHDALRTYREALVSDRRWAYVERFQRVRGQAAQTESDMQFMTIIPKYVLEVALVIGAGLLTVSQLLTKELSAAVAVIAIFLAAGSRIVPSLLRLQTAAILIGGADGKVEPTLVLARELTDTSARGAVVPRGTSAAQTRKRLGNGHPGFLPIVEVGNVSFTYPSMSVPALSEVNLTISAGQSVALVGPTGAGKSTLADVILGVIDPDEGRVQVGGVAPLEAVARWPGGIAYVPQDVAMIEGSVRDNVALGLPPEAVDDAWVWSALERAHLADTVRRREGLNTLVGERGLRLSGGQRQRLGIARALYTRPLLLVLDEATSALDAETERHLASAIAALRGEVTTVTIAHRLSTVKKADVIVYLEKGRIVSSGSFDHVRRESAHFDEQARLSGL